MKELQGRSSADSARGAEGTPSSRSLRKVRSGDATARAARNEELAARLVLAEERERRRIAEGLHDEIGQSLALLRLMLSTLDLRGSDTGLRNDVDAVVGVVDRIIESTRTLTFDLSSPILHRLGLAPALENLVDRSCKRSGLLGDLVTEGELEEIDEPLRILVFRSVSELVRNVEKHASASALHVRVTRRAGRMRAVVRDDGCGFDVEEARRGDGFGLFSLEQALAHADGRVSIESGPGRGTSVTFEVADLPGAS